MGIRLTCFLFLVLLVSCDSGHTQTAKGTAAKSSDIYLFIDKSKSVNFDVKAVAKVEAAVSNVLAQLKSAGDRVAIFYIHGNTGGSGAEAQYTVPGIVYPNNPNTMQRKKAQRDFDYTLAVARGRILQDVRTALQAANTHATAGGTDIIGGLEIASRYSDKSKRPVLVFITDGIQTSNGIKSNPVNMAQAATLAKADLGKLSQQYRISGEILRGANSYMVLPFDPMSSSHNKFLDEYWKNVFAAYGLSLQCF